MRQQVDWYGTCNSDIPAVTGIEIPIDGRPVRPLPFLVENDRPMLTYMKLESSNYWIEEENKRRESLRQEQARNTTRKVITIVAYSSCLAILGAAFAWGAFEQIDVLGAFERVGRLVGLAN